MMSNIPKLAGFLEEGIGGPHFKTEYVSASSIQGVLKTYNDGNFEVYCSDNETSAFFIFEEEFDTREEALEALERQLQQYRGELVHKIAILDKILSGPPNKSLLERIAEEGGLRED